MNRLLWSSLVGLALSPSIGFAQNNGVNGPPSPAKSNDSELLKILVTDLELTRKKLDRLEDKIQELQRGNGLIVSQQVDNLERMVQELQLKMSRVQEDLQLARSKGAVEPKPLVIEPAPKKVIEAVAANKPVTLQEQLEVIQRKLDDALMLRPQVDAQGKDIVDLKKKNDTLSSVQVELQEEVIKLRQEFARLQNQVERSARSEEGVASSSRYNPMPKPNESRSNFAAVPPVNSGTIQLVNTYPQAVTIYVDGQPHVLNTGDRKSLNYRVGNFSYSVPGIQAQVTRSLSAGETFTINVHTQY